MIDLNSVRYATLKRDFEDACDAESNFLDCGQGQILKRNIWDAEQEIARLTKDLRLKIEINRENLALLRTPFEMNITKTYNRLVSYEFGRST